MKRVLLLSFCLFTLSVSFSQDLYFPPLNGNEWATTAPEELHWCADQIPELYDYLDQTNSKAFIVLQEGKIVLEKYFDDFTQDSLWYWASAGKSLMAFTVGMAQEQGLLDIEEATAEYLGEGWTALSSEQEAAIKIRHQLTMTTGLDDTFSHCTDPDCLQYLAEPGSRWAYHNGPYTLLADVVEAASGQSINAFLAGRLKAFTGMKGGYIPSGFNKIYFSDPRSFARFGLLLLNKGYWENQPVLSDSIYFQQMIQPSQMLNPAYGYLWWLNGSDFHLLPGLQLPINGPAVPGAPEDAYSAIGKNGQILTVIPSQNLIWIRMGEDPDDDSFVPTSYSANIWEKLEAVICKPISNTEEVEGLALNVFPNPTTDQVQISGDFLDADFSLQLWDSRGQLRQVFTNQNSISLAGLAPGIYCLRLYSEGRTATERFYKN